jgi:EAL domain-containing protein (putative c-di-GMP-specific phosphodiesterase class I)
VLCDADDPLRPLTTIRRLIMDELEINGLPVAVEASVGYVVAPGDGTEVDGLLQRADVAMFVAKRQRGGITRYEEELDDYDAASLSLLADLRHALDADELVLHYQPKLSLATGVADELEALVRWAHPTFGLLGPDRFIPLAEQTELIDRLTAWVLRRALRDLHRLDAVAPDLAVAVNVSTRNLSQTKFAAAVVQAAQEVGVPTGRIIVEMTETAILLDPRRAAAVLAELAAAGVRVSLDDFGSGQTSLGHLSSLPLHELKVDRSFVTDMLDSPAHAAIVRSIVDLGHNLGLRVVAEGVETQAVREGLLAMGCDMAQGYVLSRPMDLDATEQWLADHGRPRPDHPALETAPR